MGCVWCRVAGAISIFFRPTKMKTKKSARKYAASGKLKQAIQARHKHQQIKRRNEGRKGRIPYGKATAKGKEKGPAKKGDVADDDEEEDEEMEERIQSKKQKKNDKEESEDGFLSDMGVGTFTPLKKTLN